MRASRQVLVLSLALIGCQKDTSSKTVRAGKPRALFHLSTPLVSAAGSPGRTFVAGTRKGTILVLEGGAKRGTLDGKVHDRKVTVLQLSRDGKRLLSIGGRVVALWDLPRQRLLRQVRGPQVVTAGALVPRGQVAFFGTAQGHVFRWKLDRPSAQPVRGFACGGTRVLPGRRRFPKEQRCPFGAYVEPDEGPPACLYPVTHLVVLARRLVRACRTGDAATLDLESRGIRFFPAGHLTTLTPVGSDLLLLGRADGHLRLVRPTPYKQRRTLTPVAPPNVAASHGALIAVAQQGTIRIWHRDHAEPVGEVRVGKKVIWIDLGRRSGDAERRARCPKSATGQSGGPGADMQCASYELQVLHRDGKLLSFPLELTTR